MVLEDGRVARFSGLWVFREISSFTFLQSCPTWCEFFGVFLLLKINACWYSENLCRCLAFKIFQPFTPGECECTIIASHDSDGPPFLPGRPCHAWDVRLLERLSRVWPNWSGEYRLKIQNLGKFKMSIKFEGKHLNIRKPGALEMVNHGRLQERKILVKSCTGG